MNSISSGVAIATAAAALFVTGLTATTSAVASEGTVKCAGVNSCKGHSECKTAKSDCKGLNSCKGQGWSHAKTAKACTDAGGKVVK